MAYKINIVKAEKSTQEDNWDAGCIGQYKSKTLSFSGQFPTILEAYQSLLKDKTIKADEITTISSNIFRGAGEVVKDNMASGLFRCSYNRNERVNGKVPTEQELELWKAGKIVMLLADYDIYFTVQLVGIDEAELANVLGVNNY